MSVLYLMIPMSLLLGTGFVMLFIWTVRSGQFDDVETPALRILNDEILNEHEEEGKIK